jgi:hypothetical protein
MKNDGDIDRSLWWNASCRVEQAIRYIKDLKNDVSKQYLRWDTKTKGPVEYLVDPGG